MKKTPLFIELTVSDNCNCNCTYCFEGKHPCVKPNLQVLERLLQLIVDTCKEFDIDEYDNLTISFWGGEPFMDLPFMNKLINSTKDFKFVRYHCYSNGTLVDEYKTFLAQDYILSIKDRIHILLSYDGEPHHTIKRGNNSEKIFEVAKMLLDIGIEFNFKATLSYDMIDHLPEIWDSYDILLQRFNKIFDYYPTLDTANTDVDKLDTWKNALAQLVKKEYNFYLKHNTFLFGWFKSTDKRTNCSLGNSIHMHTNGDIYICHGCAYTLKIDKFKLGNIFNINSLYEVISEKYEIHEIPISCIKCNASHCQVCHVENLKDTDDPHENWIKCRVNNKNRCMFFKYFGYYSKILRYMLINKGIFYGNKM